MKLSKRLEQPLLSYFGYQKKSMLGGGMMAASLPWAAGLLMGGVLGMAFAPKAGLQLRRDAQKWLRQMMQPARARGTTENPDEVIVTGMNGDPIHAPADPGDGQQRR